MATKAVQRWFGKAVRRYPARSAALVVLSVLTSLTEGMSISLLIPFFSTLLSGVSARPALPGPLGKFLDAVTAWTTAAGGLLTLSVLIVGLVAFTAVLKYGERTIASRISSLVSWDLRRRIHANLLRTDYEYICINDSGRLLNALDSQTWSATDAISAYFRLIASTWMVGVFTVLLLLISWRLTVAVGLLVALVWLATSPFNRRARALGVRSVSAAGALTDRGIELFDAMRMIRAYGREDEVQRRYEDESREMYELGVRSERVVALAGGLREMLYAAAVVCAVFIGLGLGLGGAVLVGYLALLHRLQPHVRAIDDLRMNLASLEASSEELAQLEALPVARLDSGDALQLPALKEAIRFEAVSFAYAGKDQEQRNALDGVSLEIPFGKVTALVGWSGAGKTTLTNLLFRFYDPKAGRITVDGTPLTQLDLDWWRSRLAIAGQDADLVDGSIADNIACGRTGASREAVIEAAKRASAHAFIEALPLGYETRVGGRGVLLSGGQRQRIGLARAFMREDAVLVLDEATNALDSMTEDQVLRAIEALKGRATVVVIAHRLSTTRMADQIVVLAAGRVAEAGTARELMRRNGLYARMAALQELTPAQAEGPAVPFVP